MDALGGSGDRVEEVVGGVGDVVFDVVVSCGGCEVGIGLVKFRTRAVGVLELVGDTE